MTTDRERLARRRARPLLLELHRALGRLGSVLTVMNTGAHPDDEQSGMLAVLRYARGMRVIVACSTRGEGGQNGLGPERGRALGILRTREMEEAARELDADVVWLGFGPDDPVHDFGFSKDGVDTLGRWGRDRLLERLVRAYRTERPDIVIPTFLDVPGQHGHHRAMTEAAEAAVALAADPAAFPEHFAEGLKPWSVPRYYLPAWSGGGGTYDDEVPPPNATLRVVAPDSDPATGAAYGEIGEWSRANHATQGMGRWSASPRSEWQLHLKLGPNRPEVRLGEGLPGTLGDLAAVLEDPAAREHIAAASVAISRAEDAFPDRPAIIPALVEAAGALERATTALSVRDRDLHGHRLARKLAEIDAALAMAAGLRPLAWIEPLPLVAGGEGNLAVHLGDPGDLAISVEPRLPAGLSAGQPDTGEGLINYPLTVAAAATAPPQFQRAFDPLGGNGAAGVIVTTEIGGRAIRVDVDLEEPLSVGPAQSVRIDPEAIIQPLASLPASHELHVSTDGPAAAVDIEPPPGGTVEHVAGRTILNLVRGLAAGRHSLKVGIGHHAAQFRRDIAYPHVGRVTYFEPTTLDVLALDLALPEGAVVGYAGGGSDRVGLWLRRMGLDVTELDAAALGGDLGRFTTIVVGIFAFGLRPDLQAATGRLSAWVEAGGHLVTLYHRPSDGWNPDVTPPRRLVIGSPSLRWRVTNPAAKVDVLAPDHPLLAGPNRIGADDWGGWEKERGLYFAKEWDPAYVPLLAMNDVGEAPLLGSLLSARIGRGRHTHTALVLHHQLDRLVPGAFRLMANLVQRGDKLGID